IHRALRVSEENGHLLALALESGTGGEDLLGEVLRRVGAGIGCWSWLRCRRERLPALQAELSSRGRLSAASGAAMPELSAALQTELGVLGILSSAALTAHLESAWRQLFELCFRLLQLRDLEALGERAVDRLEDGTSLSGLSLRPAKIREDSGGEQLLESRLLRPCDLKRAMEERLGLVRLPGIGGE